VFSSSKIEPEFKIGSAARNGKSDKTEFQGRQGPEERGQEDKDLKNEAKEDKDTKDEQKEIKDKQEKDERKESKDELKEKQEKTSQGEAGKGQLKRIGKGRGQGEVREGRVQGNKDEQKEIKGKQEKPERKEARTSAKKLRTRARKQGPRDKDIRDHKEPEFLPRGARPPLSQSAGRTGRAAQGAEGGKQEFKEFQAGVQGQQGLQGQEEKDELKETKDEARTPRIPARCQNNKLEGKDIKSEKPSKGHPDRGEGSEAGNQGSDREAGQGMGHPRPQPARLPVERRSPRWTAITRSTTRSGARCGPTSATARCTRSRTSRPRRRRTVSGGVLVLCEPYDTSALWAAAGLARRIDGPVDVITGRMLVMPRTWSTGSAATSRDRDHARDDRRISDSTRGPC